MSARLTRLLTALLTAVALDVAPAASQDTVAVPPYGSYVRIEYTRYFVRRREIVDSAEAARATRWRQLEVRGAIEEITSSHVVLRAHDRRLTVARWAIDRTWLYVGDDALEPVDDIASSGVAGLVAGVTLGGLLTVACGGWNEDYCGLNVFLGLVIGTGIGMMSGLLDAATDDYSDWRAVDL